MEINPITPSEDGTVKFEPLKELQFDSDGAVMFKSIDEAIQAYVAERDVLRSESMTFNQREIERKDRMSKISMWLRDKGDEFGVDSFRTQYGTAYRNVKTSYRVGDWSATLEWMKSTGNFQILEKRVAKNATKEIHDVTGEVPPGITFSIEVEFDVRRPTKS